MLAATLKPIRLECYLLRLSGANKVSLFRADSLDRYLLQCAWDWVALDRLSEHETIASTANVIISVCVTVHIVHRWITALHRYFIQLSLVPVRSNSAARVPPIAQSV